ncbi:MAG TPA: phosphoribosylpyrophosphate synthetase [Chitinophagaceae bacterium]|nr:phosphoribosylpyrophosphate synthetase [Chitinophagaceae bacterium]
MPAYDTVSQAINGLKERGYTLDFNLKTNSIECQGQKLNPGDFEITEFHRFEGPSDPGDEAIVYAIESRNGLKGVLVNAFGVYSETLSDEMMKKLNFSKN